MGIDWEGLLGAEGDSIQDAYEERVWQAERYAGRYDVDIEDMEDEFIEIDFLDEALSLETNKPIIVITEEMRKQAYDFAHQIERRNQFNISGQSMNELIEKTYIRKLGELVFVRYLNLVGIEIDAKEILEIYEGKTKLDSYDFIQKNGKKVQVKTGYLEKHERLVINARQFKNNPKDIYVGVQLFTDGKSPKILCETEMDSWTHACIEGYAFKREIEKTETRNWGKALAHAIAYNELRDVNDLVKYF